MNTKNSKKNSLRTLSSEEVTSVSGGFKVIPWLITTLLKGLVDVLTEPKKKRKPEPKPELYYPDDED